MIKKIFIFSFMLLTFTVIPVKAESAKVVYELHEGATVSRSVDSLEVTLASEKKNLLIKINEGYSVNRENYNTENEFLEKQEKVVKSYNDEILSKLQVSYDNVYVSKYSPYIELSYDAGSEKKMEEAIDKLVGYDFVSKIYVQDDYRPAVYMGGLIDHSGSWDYVCSDLTTDGEGVKVGILDVGVVDVDNYNLTTSNIVIRDEWYFIETVGEHATLMATIIGGWGGFAPKCTMYSVQLSGNPVSEMDWLIENGVSVCNVSIGDGEGSYNSTAAYLDYVAANYGMTICCAIGNAGEEGHVNNLALAHNCIPVGAGDRYGVLLYNSLITPGREVRPLILAPGDIDVYGFSSPGFQGTSISTAVVTGIVTLLQKYNMNYRFQFNRYRALLMANAICVPDYEYTESSYVEYESGCGLVHLQNCLDNFNNIIVVNNTGALGSSGFRHTQYYALSYNQRFFYALSYTTLMDDDDNPYRSEYRYNVVDNENRVILRIYNNAYDGFEFYTGLSPDRGMMSVETELVGTKNTSGTESLYIAYRSGDIEE